jgi:hypothetical protein
MTVAVANNMPGVQTVPTTGDAVRTQHGTELPG